MIIMVLHNLYPSSVIKGLLHLLKPRYICKLILRDFLLLNVLSAYFLTYNKTVVAG